MGGMEGRVIWVEREGGKGKGEEEIRREKIGRAIRKQRNGTTTGRDGIPSEIWRYGREKMERWAWKICNRIWRGEGWPEG